jgi:hypothetical protein
MNTEQQLYEKYRLLGIVSGEELVLPTQYAQQLVDSCEESNLAIIGIDGFTILNGAIRPELGIIADFSSVQEGHWSKYRQRCNQAARRFLSNFRHQDNLSFSFTMLNREEWKQTVRSHLVPTFSAEMPQRA